MAAHTLAASEQNTAIRRVIWITLALNLAVALAKISYGHAAGALAIRADGFHSLTDSFNNVAGLVGVWLAAKPPDENHPYGHLKLEILVSALVGLSLMGMAYDVGVGAFRRLFTATQPPDLDVYAFVVLIATLAVNLMVATYEHRRGKQLESPFLLTDAAHTRSDLLVTVGVLVGTAVTYAGYPVADIVAAAIVGLFIAFAGVMVLRQNLSYLADSKLVSEARIFEVATAIEGVSGAHCIRTRGTPRAIYMDLHIEVSPTLSIVEAHDITHSVIDALKREFPRVADVTVHTEPVDAKPREE